MRWPENWLHRYVWFSFWRRTRGKLVGPRERRRTHRRPVCGFEAFEQRRVLATTLYDFQDGVSPSTAYDLTSDVQLLQDNPNANFGSQTSINVDGDEPSGTGNDAVALLRWDVSSIPEGGSVLAAYLTLNVTNVTPHTYELYESKRDWVEGQATWNQYATGLTWQTPGAAGQNDRGTTVLGTLTAAATGSVTVSLNSAGLSVVQQWRDDPSSNHGFVVADSSATDGIDFSSRELSTASSRPKLTVAVGDDPASAPQYEVHHAPRLQPGNAPLVGYAGSATDQVQVIWQTIPIGAGTSDQFVVEYRAVGDSVWLASEPLGTIDTGVAGRINHFADILGLDFDRQYEYRVQHLRAGDVVATYQDTFRTRLPAGDTAPFQFVAYGDSAYAADLDGFRSVQNRINLLDPRFALLLGDNVYDVGSHVESDARFDPDLNPEAADWTASHIDYVGFGNHDVGTGSGKPSEDNFAVPIPVTGVTAPAEPSGSERPEHNYSFDYGQVHFVTFDTNSLGNANRLDAQLDWVVADLQASSAPWKIVFGHHPIAGVPDKSESPSGNYYQQVVSRLNLAGADLFLVGHSHTYSWTYPLTGQSGGQATYVLDTDKDYAQGAGLVQVVSGVGGKELRSGNYNQFDFVAAGFTSSTSPSARDGIALIDVTSNQLTVKYVAADNGGTIDQFSVTRSAVPQVSIAAPDSAAAEAGLDAGEFTISRNDSDGALTVHYDIGGSATSGDDYQSFSGSVTLNDGQATATIDVVPIDDPDVEGDETVSLTLTPDPAYSIGTPAAASVTIADDDVPPLIDDVAQTETTVVGGIAAGSLLNTYTSDDVYESLRESHSGGKPSNRQSLLDHRWTFEVTGGDAVRFMVEAFHDPNAEGDDFVFEYSLDDIAYQPMVTIAGTSDDDMLHVFDFPAAISGTLYVRVVDSDRAPGNSQLDQVHIDQLLVRSLTGGEPILPTVSITATDANAAEQDTDRGEFTITRSGSTSEELVVQFTATGSSASSPSDYAMIGSSVTIAAGNSSATVTIDPVDDGLAEGTEFVVLTLVDEETYHVGSPMADTVLIADNDASTTVIRATGESTIYGSVSGSYENTRSDDDVYQMLTEQLYAGNKRSRLEHQWTFPLSVGGSATFHMQAFHTSVIEDFVVQVSVDGVNWESLFVLTDNADTYLTAGLNQVSAGTILIRVMDTDRSRDESSVDTLWIDDMYIQVQ